MDETEQFRRRALGSAVFEDCAMAGARFDDVANTHGPTIPHAAAA